MRSFTASTALLLALRASAQSSESARTSTPSGASIITGSQIASSLLVPSGPYQSDSTTLSLASTFAIMTTANSSISGSSAASSSSPTSIQPTETLLVGGGGATSSGNTATRATSSSGRPTNTQACNGYPEFCSRSYGNVTQVVAHNSPFDKPNNLASNQVLGVEYQLNDGIRGLQFQTHLVNNTLRLCHTSCDLLDAGTLEAYLTTVRIWLQTNRFEVITIIIGNDDRVDPTMYVAPFQNSGILNYVYVPPSQPMNLTGWPTLGEMILRNKRVVVMLDYGANQSETPWLLDEFSYNWETPFSPTDIQFPCTEQRPPNQPDEISRNRLYMANHNLNIQVTFAGVTLLTPAYGQLELINAANDSTGALQVMNQDCTAMWNRPPNFLLVDYYNFGNFNGSVFQVAANANGVGYNRESCCGLTSTGDAGSLSARGMVAVVGAAVAAWVVL